MRDDQRRLEDILEAVARIERHTAGGRDDLDNELVETWVVHNIQIIGEAARALSDESRRRLPTVPWPQIIGMRHVLVHDYFSVDRARVWSVVAEDLPKLKREVEGLLAELRE